MDHDHPEDRTKDWRKLCEEAATELDPTKLMNLIADLTRALNERDKNRPPATGDDKRNSTGISLHPWTRSLN